MCLHIFRQYPCRKTRLLRREHCTGVLKNGQGPCMKNPPPPPQNHPLSREKIDPKEWSQFYLQNNHYSEEFHPPPQDSDDFLCNSPCRFCNEDLYNRESRKYWRELANGPDWMAPWYGMRDIDDPSINWDDHDDKFVKTFREYELTQWKWQPQFATDINVEDSQEPDPKKMFRFLPKPDYDPELWNASLSGLKTRDGRPIEEVDWEYRKLAVWKVRDEVKKRERLERDRQDRLDMMVEEVVREMKRIFIRDME